VARAGNVIGGGDRSKDRLIPDVIEALQAGSAPVLRYPNAVRPWQHVLDCLHGYLLLTNHLIDTSPATLPGAPWNFGPDDRSFVEVGEVAGLIAKFWGSDAEWSASPDVQFEEASLLALDSSKSAQLLGWENQLGFSEAVRWTVDWFQDVASGHDPRDCTVAQIQRFTDAISLGKDRRVMDPGTSAPSTGRFTG
jgi:CDP-glucose 4,6-dehydratase